MISKKLITKSGFSTPFGAPMVPPFPFEFRNIEVMSIIYESDKDSICELLPEPLEPISNAVMVHIYDMKDTDWLGPYQECNVMVSAKLPGTGISGGYSPFLFLSSDVGVVHGREVHGQPKKLGFPKIEVRGDTVVGTVTKNEIEFFRTTMCYKQKKGNLDELKNIIDFSVNLNLKVIDNIDGTPAIRQLTSRKIADVKIREVWKSECTAEIHPHVQAPLYKLPIKKTLFGIHWSGDFTLVAGRIIYDYLKS